MKGLVDIADKLVEIRISIFYDMSFLDHEAERHGAGSAT